MNAISTRLNRIPLLAIAAGIAACNETVTEPVEDSPTAPALAVAAAGSWAGRASMPPLRQGLATAVVQNASGQYILHAIGGCCGASGTTYALARVEAYNAST